MFLVFVFEIANDDEGETNPNYLASSSPCLYMECLCQMIVTNRFESF
jgi:hypothetical protein